MPQNKMDKAWESMLRNLEAKTGKPIADWIKIINAQPFTRTSEKVEWLKKEHHLTHGYAGLVIYQAKLAAQGGPDDPEELVRKQYLGKEKLRPIYDKLVELVLGFGDDVEILPRNSYVSIRRKVQFAMFSPATKERFEIMLKLKNQEPKGILEALPKPSMCTHRIKLGSLEELTPELIDWLKEAYAQA
ncbi:MAG TPA: DUF4287 domain-containing protein [Candidatus Cloacimonadota bacterium]|nr:DUF4287 domain-containing protein [Candidatus Cloacimonadota bacterium]